MKKIISCLAFIFTGILVNAQQGLEKIIVEKYYISDTIDAKAESGGHLPSGSMTFRIYVDMLPGYRFQAAYGVPGHELRIATTTLFFNNEDRGSSIANFIPKKHLKDNTIMLDSWVSVGAAAEGYFGIPKSDDDGLQTIVNEDSLLQNTDPAAGIPIKTNDGLFPASPQYALTPFGIDKEMAIFGAKNDGTNGPVFSTSNGSWASFGGAIGPNADNKVLIAQITTDGVLSFELNIQLGTPYGGVENYVARNPMAGEIQIPSLVYPLAPVKVTPKHK